MEAIGTVKLWVVTHLSRCVMEHRFICERCYFKVRSKLFYGSWPCLPRLCSFFPSQLIWLNRVNVVEVAEDIIGFISNTVNSLFLVLINRVHGGHMQLSFSLRYQSPGRGRNVELWDLALCVFNCMDNFQISFPRHYDCDYSNRCLRSRLFIIIRTAANFCPYLATAT